MMLYQFGICAESLLDEPCEAGPACQGEHRLASQASGLVRPPRDALSPARLGLG